MSSISKYKFVSPGIQVSEIDNSQVPKIANKIGPVVIGRAERGPGMRPVKVESFSEFVNIFGNTVPGGQGGDVWRDGNYTAPMYGTYAAQAWLKNNNPLTFVRLLGCQHTNAIAAGEAGWVTKTVAGTSTSVGTLEDSNGGAYGLFLIDSSSAAIVSSSAPLEGVDTYPTTGTLAAIFYLNQGAIVLSGSNPAGMWGGATTISGTAVLVESVGADQEFRALVYDRNGAVAKTTTFNFNRDSQKFIRKVFNTNPTLTNSDISQGANTASYWLGQTFETNVADRLVSGTTAGDTYGIILGLANASYEGSDFRFGSQPAKTGWYFSQDLQVVGGVANSFQPENMTKLFRFVCLDTGEWTQSNIKISIQDIKASTNPFDPYGVFTVVLRKVEDNDNAIQVVERFSSCNLNPNSPNYIAKKIGDKYVSWDDTERRYKEYGNYDNLSKFVRVEMNSDVDAAAINAELLPFGVYGPARFKGFTLISGSTAKQAFGQSTVGLNAFATAFFKGAQDIVRSPTFGTQLFNPGYLSFTGSFQYPSIPLRSASFEGDIANPKDAYWGIRTTVSTTSTRQDPAYKDLIRTFPAAIDSYSTSTEKEYSWIFTLDDIYRASTGSAHAAYVSGSRAAGISISAGDSTNYKGVLDAGFDRFTSCLYGGFDGVDITEKDPFNNTDLAGGTETTNYAFNSVKRAIDCLADPEVVEFNIMTAPGLTHEGLTAHMINVCSDRADALAIVDPDGGFIPSTENNYGDSSATNRGDVTTTVSNMKARGINSSYGCAYYPWVQIKDSINGATLWAPPSVVALGTMASSEAKSELWFAPAGFNRGGLTEGSAGIPVTGVKEKLTVKQRDKLYEANINPIASFPNEGVVIFGQKTLQVTPSALDRVNVRRMMIHIKKEVSRMAASILFDQNVKVTWNRFIGKVDPFLRSIKVRYGLMDYKIVLDETTTTPDLIDRNILYAKIFLKPAKAIEYIAIDMSIENSGASFAD